MDEVIEDLKRFVRGTVDMALKGNATEAQMDAMASVANALVWAYGNRQVSLSEQKDTCL